MLLSNTQMDQLRKAELLNGRLAMIGFAIVLGDQVLTGNNIIEQTMRLLSHALYSLYQIN